MAYLDEDVLYNNIEEKYKVSKGEARKAYSDVLDTICEMPRVKVPQKTEWISVDERLPELYTDVIAYDAVLGVQIDSVLSNGEFAIGYHVTHWMPLPEPPKMEGGAE